MDGIIFESIKIIINLYILLLQPQVGFIPWGPVLENNFTFPGDEWYDGWRERDWHFLSVPPEELIVRGQMNPSLRYMTGVTTQEAAYVLCKYSWNK